MDDKTNGAPAGTWRVYRKWGPLTPRETEFSVWEPENNGCQPGRRNCEAEGPSTAPSRDPACPRDGLQIVDSSDGGNGGGPAKKSEGIDYTKKLITTGPFNVLFARGGNFRRAARFNPLLAMVTGAGVGPPRDPRPTNNWAPSHIRNGGGDSFGLRCRFAGCQMGKFGPRVDLAGEHSQVNRAGSNSSWRRQQITF